MKDSIEMQLQLISQFDLVDKLHQQFGDSSLFPIYGAGCIYKPRIMFLFMNPTGKNISAVSDWHGIRAPWLGTKNVWKMFARMGLIPGEMADEIIKLSANEWTEELCNEIYSYLAENGVYISNLAKCTQIDARPLSNSVFSAYRDQVLSEIKEIDPANIITFGNQVSSVLLQKPISVSDYTEGSEGLEIDGKVFRVFPCYYPVGQGTPNMPKAIARINRIISNYV